MIKNTKETSSTLIKDLIDDYIDILVKTNKYVEKRGGFFNVFVANTFY